VPELPEIKMHARQLHPLLREARFVVHVAACVRNPFDAAMGGL